MEQNYNLLGAKDNKNREYKLALTDILRGDTECIYAFVVNSLTDKLINKYVIGEKKNDTMYITKQTLEYILQ